MSSAASTTTYPAVERAIPSSEQRSFARLFHYIEITKPKISLMVLVTVTVGYSLGCTGNWNLVRLIHTLLGVAIVAAGSSGFNQFLERHTDALMTRTRRRPIPSGRLRPQEVLAFSILAGALGTAYLAVAVNLLTAALTLLTYLLYVGVYTPLKRRTSLCTAVGAIPGALPPVLGWTAAGGTLEGGAFALFAILFLWQFPHFLAIAWLNRQQYAEAGLRMLPAKFPKPGITGLMGVVYAVVLIPVSLLPRVTALSGDFYLVAAVLLGLIYAHSAMRFALHESVATARRVLWTSLIYLPTLLLALTWDHWRLLQ